MPAGAVTYIVIAPEITRVVGVKLEPFADANSKSLS